VQIKERNTLGTGTYTTPYITHHKKVHYKNIVK